MEPSITITPWEMYDTITAEQVGALQPQLDPSFSGAPIPIGHFREYFEDHSDRTMLLALSAGKKVVGVATMNALAESSPQANDAYMGGFVVDTESRGTGAAEVLWDGMLDWCKERGLPGFTFKTEAHRSAAIKFYERMGATLLAGNTESKEMYFCAQTPGIPAAVLSAFGSRLSLVEPLGNGRVHQTYLVTDGQTRVVVQRVNEEFAHTATREHAYVSQSFASKGWEVPLPIKTKADKLTVSDYESQEWRCQTYLDNDPVPHDLSERSMTAVGQLLAKWHKTAREIEHVPRFPLPFFHNTAHHRKLLEREVRSSHVKGYEAQVQAQDIMQTYDSLEPIPESPAQLIHGDPQLNNMLFRKDLPFTIIDLDTVMLGNIWVDVGDLLRSLLERQADCGKLLSISQLEPVMQGYWQESDQNIDYAAFRKAALLSTQHLALELAMRFVIDRENGYFAWDQKQFKTRRDHHYSRAQLQQEIALAVARS